MADGERDVGLPEQVIHLVTRDATVPEEVLGLRQCSVHRGLEPRIVRRVVDLVSDQMELGIREVSPQPPEGVDDLQEVVLGGELAGIYEA